MEAARGTADEAGRRTHSSNSIHDRPRSAFESCLRKLQDIRAIYDVRFPRAIVAHFLSVHPKTGEEMVSEDRGDRYVPCVAATGYNNSTYPAPIMSRIKCKPPVAEIHFHPSTKIHRIRNWRNANIAQITRYVSG